jgi:hypothetical protein
MSSQQERGVNGARARHSAAGALAAVPDEAVAVRELQERYKTADLSDRELQDELSHYLSIMGYVRVFEGLRERAEPRLKALEAEMWERHRREQRDSKGPKELGDACQARQ